MRQYRAPMPVTAPPGGRARPPRDLGLGRGPGQWRHGQGQRVSEDPGLLVPAGISGHAAAPAWHAER